MNPTTRRPRPQTGSAREAHCSASNAGMPAPSPNGRTSRGRFAKGNPGGPGNPHAKQTTVLRSALLEAITEEDIREIAQSLVRKAKAGDTHAIKELFNRVIGKAPEDPLSATTQVMVIGTGVPDRISTSR